MGKLRKLNYDGITFMTKLMGILNVTPDSFFDKGKFFDIDSAVKHGLEMHSQGADIIDIGGESTRPGSAQVDIDEEMKRVIPIIEALHVAIPTAISIDTRNAKTAAAAIIAGASIINDVSGFQDPAMQEVAASSNADLCVMHMQGSPQTMQNNPSYPDGIISHLIRFFETQITLLMKRGVKSNRIILDPGIGFGKTVADNLEIIQNLPKLKTMGFPLLLGISRKSFMGKILHLPASELLPATIAINTLLIMSHVDVIRVHDVAEHRAVIELLKQVTSK